MVSGVDTALGSKHDLGRIFKNKEIVFVCNFFDCRHIGKLAEKVNRHDPFCFWSDSGFDQIGSDIECFGIDIDHDRDCSELSNDFNCCNKTECGGNDFIAGFYACSLKHDSESIGTGVDRNSMFNSVAFGNSFF